MRSSAALAVEPYPTGVLRQGGCRSCVPVVSLDAMVTTVCPTCGTELRSREQYAGWPVRCSQCGTICRFPGTVSPETALPETAPVAAEAVSEARCVICGKEIRPGQQWVQLADGLAGHSTCYEDVLPPDGQPAIRGTTPSGILSGTSGAFRYSEPSQPPQPSLPADDLWSQVAVAAASEEVNSPLLPPVRSQRDGFYRQLIGLGIAAPVVSLLLIALLMTLPSAEVSPPPSAPVMIVRDAETPPSLPPPTSENIASQTAPEAASAAIPRAKAEETPSSAAPPVAAATEVVRTRTSPGLPGKKSASSETRDRSSAAGMPLWACVLMTVFGLVSIGLGITGLLSQRGPVKSKLMTGRGRLVAGLLNVVLGLFLLVLAGRFTLQCLGLW